MYYPLDIKKDEKFYSTTVLTLLTKQGVPKVMLQPEAGSKVAHFQLSYPHICHFPILPSYRYFY